MTPFRTRNTAIALACLSFLAFSLPAGAAEETGSTAVAARKVTPQQLKDAQASQGGVDSSLILANAPSSYTVKPGDTLWKISSLFLKSPWLWPALWGFNMDEIKNPHLIYPGNVLNLTVVNGKARLSQGTGSNQEIRLSPGIRIEEQLNASIPAVQKAAVLPFLIKPIMVDDEAFVNSGVIASAKDNRLNIGPGGILYASGMPEGASAGDVFSIYRPGRAVDDTFVDERGRKVKERLGVESVHLGEARIVRKNAEGTFTMEVTKAEQEIAKGDRLMRVPANSVFSYVPHAPTFNVKGRVVMMHDGRTGSSLLSSQTQSRAYETEGSKHSVIVLNQGDSTGLESGHVVELVRPARVTEEKSTFGFHMGNRVKEPTRLPAEVYGHAMVFKTFSKLSYAIVLDAESSVLPGDEFVTPGELDR